MSSCTTPGPERHDDGFTVRSPLRLGTVNIRLWKCLAAKFPSVLAPETRKKRALQRTPDGKSLEKAFQTHSSSSQSLLNFVDDDPVRREASQVNIIINIFPMSFSRPFFLLSMLTWKCWLNANASDGYTFVSRTRSLVNWFSPLIARMKSCVGSFFCDVFFSVFRGHLRAWRVHKPHKWKILVLIKQSRVDLVFAKSSYSIQTFLNFII